MASNITSVEIIKEKLTPIFEEYPVNKAILFGSYAKGNVTTASDIDLYMIPMEIEGLDFGRLNAVSTLEIDIDLIDRSHIKIL